MGWSSDVDVDQDSRIKSGDAVDGSDRDAIFMTLTKREANRSGRAISRNMKSYRDGGGPRRDENENPK